MNFINADIACDILDVARDVENALDFEIALKSLWALVERIG